MAFLITLIFEAAKGSIEWHGPPYFEDIERRKWNSECYSEANEIRKTENKKKVFLNSFH